MDRTINEIYSELRKTKEELIQRLQNDNCSSIVKPYIEGELEDIEVALKKLETGTFGTCEISGEIMPEYLLSIVPTLKSIEDCKMMSYFFRKTD
jgi:RNA polymerase-binding transcription factor DksA